jgi:hypothetical protein
MIALLTSISSGNAVSVLLNPPSTAVKWRILRNLTGVFADQNSATLVYEGNERHFTDIAGLDNGIVVFYQPFYWNGSVWSTAPAKSITPGLTFVDRSVDVLSLVRDRLDAGFAGLVARGDLTHPRGNFPVLTASPQVEDAAFPIVTVHLSSDSDDVRFVGDTLHDDVMNVDESVSEINGWLSQYSLEIVVWSLNGDERKALRAAMKTILISNLTVFSSNEMEEISLQFSDQEDFETYQSPMYTGHCSLRCLAPTVIDSSGPAVKSTDTIGTTYW